MILNWSLINLSKYFPPTQHHSLGESLLGPLLPQLLCCLLQLCFRPEDTREHERDTQHFREQLERLFNSLDPSHAIEKLLLIKGCSKVNLGKENVKLLLMLQEICYVRFLFINFIFRVLPGSVNAVAVF